MDRRYLEPDPWLHQGEPLDDVSASLHSLVVRRLRSNYHRSKAYTESEVVEDSIAGMSRIASYSGAAFVLVVFPDRVLVDPTLREAIDFGNRSADYDLERWHRLVSKWSATIPTIDLRSTLAGRTEVYRARDTHLNDLGNVVVGERVAEKLGSMIGERLVSKYRSSGGQRR